MVPTFTGVGDMFGLPTWSSHCWNKIVVGMAAAPKAVATSPSGDACQLLLTNSRSPTCMLPSTYTIFVVRELSTSPGLA
jgi:hypothetical protein